MAYTIYEYAAVAEGGQPIEGDAARTASKAFGAAHKVAATTVYVAVVPDAAMYLRISGDGAAATAADHKLEAGKSYGFPVPELGRPSLYGLAA